MKFGCFQCWNGNFVLLWFLISINNSVIPQSTENKKIGINQTNSSVITPFNLALVEISPEFDDEK